jgi:hypothetical protein
LRIPHFKTLAATAVAAFMSAVSASPTQAIGQKQFVAATPSAGSFTIAQNGTAAKIYVDSGDYPGVLRAANDLATDTNRVTGITPFVSQNPRDLSGSVIVIGTLGKCALIDRLASEGKINLADVRNKWEATLIEVVPHPASGIDQALVIVGSDKRGAIFGIYDLSEQIGVSPWYWWADVPVEHREALYVAAGRYVHGEPAVKYRGIFLNDEAPSLTGWVNEKYGGYNHQFYEKVFELLLRLRANFLWPAMWNSAFSADDPLNPKLADEYGIVMGTSHEEPMMRAEKEWTRGGHGAWDYTTSAKEIDDFWRAGIARNKGYENIVTLGMRGANDTAMSASTNTALLEKIVADQRQILSDEIGANLPAIPQVWALYKEVQTYYEQGMRVPDDVTLLWSDDNWGDLRRVPTPEERKRAGGAGIYYHFDYVGGPRSYKWINTNPLPKMWQQLGIAHAYGANRIWVVNVGDLKPMEFPIEFFLTYARDPDEWGAGDLDTFTVAWAAREFGPERAAEIASLVSGYTKFNGRRKPELLDANTFSVLNYGEADRVYAEWQNLADEADKISNELPPDRRDAFFELVLYPVKASAVVNQLYIAAGKNRLYAAQGRASANDLAVEARALFAEDAKLSDEYNHTLLNGKWNHMMDQTHIGYTFWNEPPLNAMPAVSEVQPAPTPRMGVAAEDASYARSPLPFDVFDQETRYIDVFNQGTGTFEFTATSDQPWIIVAPGNGTTSKDQRVAVSVDWAKAPAGRTNGVITFQQQGGASVQVRLEAFKPETPSRDSADGFVESDDVVSIEAEHFTGQHTTTSAAWKKLPDYGATLSAMTIFPVDAPSVEPPAPAATIEYKMYLFESGEFNVETILAPALNYVPGRGLRFAIAFDDRPPLVVDALAANTRADWEQAVSDGVRKIQTTLAVDAPGWHTLKVSMVDPGVVLEKIVVSHGSLKPSYLGPPESFCGECLRSASKVE